MVSSKHRNQQTKSQQKVTPGSFVQRIFLFFKKPNTYYYLIPILFLTAILFVFENCGQSRIMDEFSGFTNYKYGVLNTYLATDQSKTLSDHFDVNDRITVLFESPDPQSVSFEWSVNRGFDDISVNPQTTSEDSTTMVFSQASMYELLSISYDDESKELGRAAKRIAVGACEHEYSILEIQLTNGSLVQGGQATFQIVGSSSFSNIKWKRDGGQSIQGDSIDLDFSLENTDDVILLEVEATYQPNCITYRKKYLLITETAQPYFNFVKPADNNHPVILENNDIYKYKKSSTSKYLHISISGATRCDWNGETINSCGNGRANLTNATNNKCTNHVRTATAFYNINGVAQSVYKQYYEYCPKNHDFCYFGPIAYRPGTHYCHQNEGQYPFTDEDHGLASTEPSPSPTPTPTPQEECSKSNEYKTQTACESALPSSHSHGACHRKGSCWVSICPSSQQNKNYGVKNNQCVPSCGHACNESSASGSCASGNDCNDTSRYNITGMGVTYDASQCCKRTSKTQPQCNCNNSQNNGCKNGCSAEQRPSDTNSKYRWTCTRDKYNDSGTCSKAKPQCTCDNSKDEGCGAGCSAKHPPNDTNSHYKWKCTRSGYTDSGTCSKKKPEPKQCTCDNSKDEGCGAGCSAKHPPNDTNSHYKWKCTRSGYTDSGTCSKKKPEPKQCTCDNSKDEGCGAGCSAKHPPNDTNSHYKWKCTRSGYTDSGTCSKRKPEPKQCTCDNSKDEGCGAGCSAKHPPNDTNSHYKWKCTRSGYTDSGTCSKRKPEPKQCTCDNSKDEGCGAGCSAKHPPNDTNSHYKWKCTRSGYTDSGTCSKRKPEPKQCTCDNSKDEGCGAGCSAKHPPNDTNSHYKWKCTRSGYTDSGTCSKRKPEPQCTGSGEYLTKKICMDHLPSTGFYMCYKDGKCWKQKKDPDRSCGQQCNHPKLCVARCGYPHTRCDVKDVNGVCHPSCGYNAVLAGGNEFGHYGRDHTRGTNDDPHVLRRISNCKDLKGPKGYGDDEWVNIPLIDNRKPWDVLEKPGYLCCGRVPPFCDQRTGRYRTKGKCESQTRQICQSEKDLSGRSRCWYGRGTSTSSSTTTTRRASVCASNQRPPTWKVVNGQCLPSCGHACNQQRSVAGDCASGNSCNDTANYNITDMGATHDTSKCCKREKKAPTVPDPKCSSGSANCADNGSGSGCCRVGHYHNHPGDSNTQWKWTCRKTANSSAGEIKCDGNKPSTSRCTRHSDCPGRCDYCDDGDCVPCWSLSNYAVEECSEAGRPASCWQE